MWRRPARVGVACATALATLTSCGYSPAPQGSAADRSPTPTPTKPVSAVPAPQISGTIAFALRGDRVRVFAA